MNLASEIPFLRTQIVPSELNKTHRSSFFKPNWSNGFSTNGAPSPKIMTRAGSPVKGSPRKLSPRKLSPRKGTMTVSPRKLSPGGKSASPKKMRSINTMKESNWLNYVKPISQYNSKVHPSMRVVFEML